MNTVLILVAIVFIFFIGKIYLNTQRDKQDLIGKNLEEKFNVIVNKINQFAFNGEGKVRYIDKKHFTLYPDTSNQIVEFLYSQGVLSVTWKYKYFQKEMVYRRNLSNVRNLSLFEQEKIANGLIEEMSNRIELDQKSVTNNV